MCKRPVLKPGKLERTCISGNPKMFLILLAALSLPPWCLGYRGEVDLRTRAPFHDVPGH